MFGCVCLPGLVRALAIAAVAACLGGTAVADGFPRSMKVSGWATAPVGHIAFCRSHPDECLPQGGRAPALLDDERWAELQAVNLSVNHALYPATDLEIYGAEELWTLPGIEGDCEDYVLLKRKRLVELGWSTGSLLVTVVFDEVDDGHAILIARTSYGDFALDNKTDQIRLWNETGYRFVKRQSDGDPRRWVSVGNPRYPARSTAAAQ